MKSREEEEIIVFINPFLNNSSLAQLDYLNLSFDLLQKMDKALLITA
ncbi:MAG: hypothetical protein ACI84K_001958 [Pseudohongiellaceae bacterium]|jgi:hypothetical protein